MLGDPNKESVFDRLWSKVADRLGFFAPVWIIRGPETLVVQDYRPTFFMFLTGAGTLFFVGLFVILLFNIPLGIDSFGLWATGAFAVICMILSLKGTIREVYYFHKPTDAYMFVRQFIYRKEVIEGSMSQFTGTYVKTETSEETEVYFVMLKQDGMFLMGINEQKLREEVPIFNTWSNEARIANAISGYFIQRQEKLRDEV